MKDTEFCERLIDIAENKKTLYVMGAFGAPMNEKNKTRYINNGSCNSYNAQPERKAMIEAADENTFAFDCVNLIKGVLWGFNGDNTKTYGGAEYCSNNVPDVGTETIIGLCTKTSVDFTNIVPGEIVYMSGHVGVYIGNDTVIECTPNWKNCVQKTCINNQHDGLPYRTWREHGKLMFIDYSSNEERPEDKYLKKKEADDRAKELQYEIEPVELETVYVEDEKKQEEEIKVNIQIDWKDLLVRAAWTFVEGFVVALPTTISLDMDGAAWKSALAAAAMAGVSAVKTLIVEIIESKK